MTVLSSAHTSDRPRKVWWLIGVVLLMACVLLQMPASWLLTKVAPQSSSIQHISGNFWHGSGIVQLPTSVEKSEPISGQISWQFKPLKLLTAKFGADVSFKSGQTRLDGEVSKGFDGWYLQDIEGKVDQSTLENLVNWRLPDAPIQINALSLTFQSKDDEGSIAFHDVDGQLTWAGGHLGYPSGGKTFDLNLPPMQANLSSDKKNEVSVIHASLVDDSDKRLGDFYLDGNGMLDVQLTQRLLENMPSYQGSAPLDTSVISVRQPIMNGLMTGGQ